MPETIALLTNETYLMKQNADGKWEEFVPITSYPQLGSEPDTHEVTRLKDRKKRFILGLQGSEGLPFEANYLLADFQKLTDESVTDEVNVYRLCFGDKLGTDGCFEWSGRVSAHVSEGAPNAVRKMAFTISDEGDKELDEVAALTEDQLAA